VGVNVYRYARDEHRETAVHCSTVQYFRLSEDVGQGFAARARELDTTWKEASIVQFKVLPQHLRGGTEGIHEKLLG
jgi:hypothetical protein